MSESQSSTLYRLNFLYPLCNEYTKDRIKMIISDYIGGLEHKSIYDNLDRCLNFIDNDFNILDISLFGRYIEKSSELDIIDYIRYKAYYTNLTPIEVIKALNIKIDDNDYVTSNGVTYTWNSRKNYFTEVERKLSFYMAIPIIENRNIHNSIEINGRVLVWGIIDVNIFLVVEVDNKDKVRIISFRRSDEKEFSKYIKE